MKTNYSDYSNNIGLRVRYALQRFSYLPIKGASRIADLVSTVVPKPSPDGLCIIKTIHGFMILVDPVRDKGLERNLFIHGTYEEGTLNILKSILKKGGFFVDVGANIGLMSLYAASVIGESGKVLSFEPFPSTYDILLENIKLNNLGNIEAVNIAVGSTKGSVDIFENIAISRGSSSLIKPDHPASGHKVHIERLDKYVEEQASSNKIDCIKIDVEGWELEVLKGATKILSGSDAPICIIECSTTHPTHGGSLQDIFTFLRNVNSYRIFRLSRGKEKPSKLIEIECKEDLPRHDNLFCFLPGHIEKLPGGMFRHKRLNSRPLAAKVSYC